MIADSVVLLRRSIDDGRAFMSESWEVYAVLLRIESLGRPVVGY